MPFFSSAPLGGERSPTSQYEQFVAQLMQQYPQLGQMMQSRPAGPGTTLHEWGYDPSPGGGGIPMPSAGQFNQPLTMFEGAAQGQPESISGSLAMGGQSRGSNIGPGMPFGAIPLQQPQGPQFQANPTFAQPGGGLTGGTTPTPPIQPSLPASQTGQGTAMEEQPWAGGGGSEGGFGTGTGAQGQTTSGFGTFGTMSPVTGALDAKSLMAAQNFFGNVFSMGIPGLGGQLGSAFTTALSNLAPPQNVNLAMEAPGTTVGQLTSAQSAYPANPASYAPVFSEQFNPTPADLAMMIALGNVGPNPSPWGLAKDIATAAAGYATNKGYPQPFNILTPDVINAFMVDPLAPMQHPEAIQAFAQIQPYLNQQMPANMADQSMMQAMFPSMFSFDPALGMTPAMAMTLGGYGGVQGTNQTLSQALGMGAGGIGFGGLSLGQLGDMANNPAVMGEAATANPTAGQLADLSMVKTPDGLKQYIAKYSKGGPGGAEAPNDVGLAAEEAGIAESGLAGPSPTSAPPGMVSDEGIGGMPGVGPMGPEGPGPGDTGGVGPEGGEW